MAARPDTKEAATEAAAQQAANDPTAMSFEQARTPEQEKLTVTDVARQAMDYFISKKDEIRQKLAEIGENTKEKLGQTDESARQKMEVVKERAKEREEEGREEELKNMDESEKGRDATENIYGLMPSLTEAIKMKMVMPNEVVEAKRGKKGGAEVGDERDEANEEVLLKKRLNQ